jgi:hypothetical protein
MVLFVLQQRRAQPQGEGRTDTIDVCSVGRERQGSASSTRSRCVRCSTRDRALLSRINLYSVCLSGNALIIIIAGADPNIGEKSGYSPMHGAGFQGRATITKLLIDFGVPFQGDEALHDDG